MGVGRPKDFVTIVNRFPTHDQWLADASNDRFVTTNLIETISSLLDFS